MPEVLEKQAIDSGSSQPRATSCTSTWIWSARSLRESKALPLQTKSKSRIGKFYYTVLLGDLALDNTVEPMISRTSVIRDCAIIIWRGGSKINRGGLNLNQSAG